MRAEKIAQIEGVQDGAIWGDFLFHFWEKGECSVHKISELKINNDSYKPFSEFTLDKAELICPHSNAVSFSEEYYQEGDEFPLLYSTLYNTYKKCDDRREGTCCVYRIWRENDVFRSKLVQLIRIGFVENRELWKSLPEKEDVRPYGNFAVDKENKILYAFVMRDKTQKTRFFKFELPSFTDGEWSEELGAPIKVLGEGDVVDYFDTEYVRYMQGACCHNGLIYSVEGFSQSEENPAAVRIIDPCEKKEIFFKKFGDIELHVEPEFIDYSNGVCYYVDGHGNVFNLYFE